MKRSRINLISIFFSIIISLFIKSESKKKKIGAYGSTPNPDNLEYRTGNGLGYFGNGWDDAKLSNLSSYSGYDGQRKKLPEYHLETWTYRIELGDCQTNTKCGILDVVGYLCGPTEAHSSKRLPYNNDNKEIMPPANLYEPIWLKNGSVNPNNYWADYINKTVSVYKNYIKIWETWNEPDYTRNYDVVGKWKSEPPNQNDLLSWHGTIFEYIRLLRITYEVAKKADPSCWIATGGLGYTSFLDGILRYTDNPKDGSVNNDYPELGGAYFDCEAYHQYPQYGVTDEETGEAYNDFGSDSLAKKVVILGKNHRYTIKKYGFGKDYPEKILINTETGYDSGDTQEKNLIRRNWIIKLALYQIEYDIKQIHSLYLGDGGIKGMGDFQNLGQYVSIEEGFKHLKDSSKGRLILKKLNIGKFKFDESKTKKWRKSLPENMTGIVLKRKFPKVENEAYYAEYIYSVWLNCIKEEIGGEINTKLSLPFNPRKIDWLGNEKNISKNSKIAVTSTPIFLIGNEKGTSGFVTFLKVVGIILLIILIIGFISFVGFYCYKRFVKKKYIPLDKGFFSALLS